jgi:hypothetical protein
MDNTLTKCAAVDETVVFLNYFNLRGQNQFHPSRSFKLNQACN